MAFQQRGDDRRQRYSFLGHLKRALETKGLQHILFTTLGTLAIASVAFAYCSGDHITGPSSGGSSASTPKSGSPNGTPDDDEDDPDRPVDPGILRIPIDIGPPGEIEASFGPIPLPIDMQATPCNHDVVLWDPSRTYITMSGFMVLNPVTGVVHIRGHFVERSKGVGMLVFPTRRYVGFEKYDKAFDIVPPMVADEEEFMLHVIASGNIEPFPLYPPDDFIMYVRVRTVMYLGVLRVESVKAYTKCW